MYEWHTSRGCSVRRSQFSPQPRRKESTHVPPPRPPRHAARVGLVGCRGRLPTPVVHLDRGATAGEGEGGGDLEGACAAYQVSQYNVYPHRCGVWASVIKGAQARVREKNSPCPDCKLKRMVVAPTSCRGSAVHPHLRRRIDSWTCGTELTLNSAMGK